MPQLLYMCVEVCVCVFGNLNIAYREEHDRTQLTGLLERTCTCVCVGMSNACLFIQHHMGRSNGTILNLLDAGLLSDAIACILYVYTMIWGCNNVQITSVHRLSWNAVFTVMP